MKAADKPFSIYYIFFFAHPIIFPWLFSITVWGCTNWRSFRLDNGGVIKTGMIPIDECTANEHRGACAFFVDQAAKHHWSPMIWARPSLGHLGAFHRFHGKLMKVRTIMPYDTRIFWHIPYVAIGVFHFSVLYVSVRYATVFAIICPYRHFPLFRNKKQLPVQQDNVCRGIHVGLQLWFRLCTVLLIAIAGFNERIKLYQNLEIANSVPSGIAVF